MRRNVSKTNPESPAIGEVADVIERCFPEITLFTTNNESPGTRHTSGLAIDIMLDSNKAASRHRAEGMIAAFIKLNESMMWSDIIYTDYHIPAGRGGYGGTRFKPNSYTQDRRHFDHIHMDWVDFSLKNAGAEYRHIPYQWSEAAKTTGFADALYKELAALAGAAPAPLPVMVNWIDGWWEVVQEGTSYYYVLSSADGSAAWTYHRPASSTAPRPADPENRGTFFVTAADRFVVTWERWSTMSTVEHFQRTNADNSDLAGTSNRAGPLTATKIV
jgi:hypothetical protein